MPSPKSGNAGSPVPPADPKSAQAADKANPGEATAVKAEQRQTQGGTYGSTQIQPHKKPTDLEQKKKKPNWIAIKLEDKEGNPVAGAAYRIALPDGKTVAEGTLDDKGHARVDGIDPGSCKVTFPNLDRRSWKPK